jgi:hypothetical protein
MGSCWCLSLCLMFRAGVYVRSVWVVYVRCLILLYTYIHIHILYYILYYTLILFSSSFSSLSLPSIFSSFPLPLSLPNHLILLSPIYLRLLFTFRFGGNTHRYLLSSSLSPSSIFILYVSVFTYTHLYPGSNCCSRGICEIMF